MQTNSQYKQAIKDAEKSSTQCTIDKTQIKQFAILLQVQ